MTDTPIDLTFPIAMLLIMAFTIFFIYFASHGNKNRIQFYTVKETKPRTKTKKKPIHKTKPFYPDSIELEDSEDEEELDFPIIDEWEDS